MRYSTTPSLLHRLQRCMRRWLLQMNWEICVRKLPSSVPRKSSQHSRPLSRESISRTRSWSFDYITRLNCTGYSQLSTQWTKKPKTETYTDTKWSRKCTYNTKYSGINSNVHNLNYSPASHEVMNNTVINMFRVLKIPVMITFSHSTSEKHSCDP